MGTIRQRKCMLKTACVKSNYCRQDAECHVRTALSLGEMRHAYAGDDDRIAPSLRFCLGALKVSNLHFVLGSSSWCGWNRPSPVRISTFAGLGA